MRSPQRDRGASAVELAVLASALMMISMLILQFGLWFNARQAALASAQAGATVAREQAASSLGGSWQGQATSTARKYYTSLNSHLLGKLNAVASGSPQSSVYVTVSGQLGYSLLPFLKLPVSATAGGPVECFRPAPGGQCG